MDKALKQRLVGASILIALAVIFLPMLFDGGDRESSEQRELALDIPEQPAGERRVRRIALEPESEPESAAETAPQGISRAEPVPDRSVAEPAADRRGDRPTVPEQEVLSPAVETGPATDDEIEAVAADETEQPEPESEPESRSEQVMPAARPPEAEPGGDWSVQVAVFSSPDTARTVSQRLESLGHTVRMDALVRNETELHRLRTGPYASRSAAERAREQIAATVAGVEPVVRESDRNGAERSSGLAVQVGSFASRNNAERLADQLSAAGYDAFVHDEDAGGRTIWRVRVGSFADRADADRLLETLREDEGLDGIVVSHP